MKINTEVSAGVSTQQTGRTEEVSRVQSQQGQKVSTGSAGGDQVDLSSLAERVAEATAAAETDQANKVDRLAALYQSGQYRVDSSKVSAAIVQHALDQGSEIPK
jgi:flagellar biosynthesis anti-sigma factor FlgM